ncbi:DUF917 domain-containing protein [Umezawaea sp. Da 62-37]|uniref:DUF917 domain-containing protein n=1 Tax=Umezawaea sp. Da 62-37 TaxID=3075927 RepID=UPI0028F70F81|nr:DUF917 domain-containing protein [Umezawaea sp. Da 62-37]WNV87950.1 DUF917 domain-containing protein [Umezawaea sp. Da 62-37]
MPSPGDPALRNAADPVHAIDREALDHLALGATLIGSGGGGRVEILAALAALALTGRPPIPVVPAERLPADTWVAHVAFMGAPLTMSEKLPTGVEIAAVAAALAQRAGVELGAIGCLQVGGQNAVAAVLAALHLGLPLVDGDAMGRAFPNLEQTTLAAFGWSVNPLALMCPMGDLVFVETDNTASASRIAGSVVVQMGGWAALGVHLVQADRLAVEGLPGTISEAVRKGGAFARFRDRATERTPRDLADALDADLLFHGSVIEIARARTPDEPAVLVLGEDREPFRVARVDMLQEYLVVAVDGNVVATVPDVLFLVSSSGVALDIDRLRLGQQVSVLRFPCHPHWLRAEALPLVVPAAFGIRVDPVLSWDGSAYLDPESAEHRSTDGRRPPDS